MTTAEDSIRNTLSLYCHYIDDRDKEGYISLFSRNAILHSARADRVGHDGVREHINEVYERWPEQLRTKHLLGACLIEVADDGQTADATTDVVVFQCLEESHWALRQTARYFDKLILEDGEWRFQDRRIDSDTYILKILHPTVS